MRYINNVAPLIPSVPKFNGTNYAEWRASIAVVLLKEGVWDIVEGSTPRPKIDTKITDEKEIAAHKSRTEEWDRASTSAKATIMLCIELAYQHRIPDSSTAPQIWLAFYERFGTVSRARRCQYRSAFWNATHSPSAPVDTYINTVLASARRLQQISITITDEDIAETLVWNLDSSWQAVNSSLMGLPTLTLEVVESQLVNHQHQLDGFGTGTSTDPMVDAAANAARVRKCFLCDDPAHGVDKCPFKEAFKSFIRKEKKKNKGHSACSTTIVSFPSSDESSC